MEVGVDKLPGKGMFCGFLRFLVDWGWWWSLGIGIVSFLFGVAVGVCAALDVSFLSDSMLRDFSIGFKGYKLDLLIHPFRPWAYWILFLFAGFLYGYLLVVLYLLRQIMHSMDGGTPFTAVNARRIRRMGLTVFVAAILQMPPVFWGLNFLVRGRSDASLSITPSLGFSGPVFFAVLLLALAEVFQYGVGLQEDRDLTV